MRHRYEALDGLRGLAALAVLLLHMGWRLGIQEWTFPQGGLAVDFFFVLSGFVVAYSYEDKLKQAGSFVPFLLKRLIRLYPLILLGHIFGLAIYVLYYRDLSAATWLAGVAGALVLPYPFPGMFRIDAIFPMNPPAWSIFFEIAINIAYALFVTRLNRGTAALVMVGCLAMLAYVGLRHGRLFIDEPPLIMFLGAARVGFSFTVGVLIYRYRESLTLRLPFLLVCLLLAAMMCAPRFATEWLYQLPCIVIVIPLLIIAGKNCVVQGRLAQACEYAGALSYPIYILHFPALIVLKMINDRFAFTGLAMFIYVGLSVLVIAGLSHLALRLIDEPLRRYLTAKVMNRPRPQTGMTKEGLAGQ